MLRMCRSTVRTLSTSRSVTRELVQPYGARIIRACAELRVRGRGMRIPSAANTASKTVVNRESRSRSRNFTGAGHRGPSAGCVPLGRSTHPLGGRSVEVGVGSGVRDGRSAVGWGQAPRDYRVAFTRAPAGHDAVRTGNGLAAGFCGVHAVSAGTISLVTTRARFHGHPERVGVPRPDLQCVLPERRVRGQVVRHGQRSGSRCGTCWSGSLPRRRG
jgi:hypothetical protein